MIAQRASVRCTLSTPTALKTRVLSKGRTRTDTGCVTRTRRATSPPSEWRRHLPRPQGKARNWSDCTVIRCSDLVLPEAPRWSCPGPIAGESLEALAEKRRPRGGNMPELRPLSKTRFRPTLEAALGTPKCPWRLLEAPQIKQSPPQQSSRGWEGRSPLINSSLIGE